MTATDIPSRASTRGYAASAAALTALALFGGIALPQTPDADASWFGVPLPPGFETHQAPVVLGDRPPEPARVPPGEERFPHLDGAAMEADMRTLVSYALESRERKEIGDGQFWGRIGGLPSAAEATEWVVGQLEQAGIEDIEVQHLQQDEGAALWLPLRWEMALVANSAAGPDSSDVVLESAMPLPRSELPEGGITAPLVYVGTGSAAESMHADVQGKIVLRRVSPQAHSFFESQATFESARQLFGRGAAAVVNMMDMPGNARSFDYFGCGVACFNLGGQDSRFLRAVLNGAAEAATAEQLRMRLTLETESLSGLTAQNALAVIPGVSDEVVLIVSHVDSWFDGANDNADGLAVTLALARHFAALDRQLERTLIFLISVGHHTAGLNGPLHFVRMNPDIVDRTVLAINVEHVAARNLVPARTFYPDGHREFDADTGESPISAGITNESPYLQSLIDEGVARYGTNFVSGNSTASSGESQWLINLGFPVLTIMQAYPLYHTSGEVAEIISTPGMERMARFLAFYIAEASGASTVALGN